jgi:hypothetical protein
MGEAGLASADVCRPGRLFVLLVVVHSMQQVFVPGGPWCGHVPLTCIKFCRVLAWCCVWLPLWCVYLRFQVARSLVLSVALRRHMAGCGSHWGSTKSVARLRIDCGTLYTTQAGIDLGELL